MNNIIKRYIKVSTMLLFSFTSYALAAPALPVSSQTSGEKKEERIQLIPEIKIDAQASTSTKNPKLKDGSACSDENLEEVDGEVFSEIPMAKTTPCDSVDCQELGAAKMHKDDYVQLKTAETISCEK